MLESGSSAHGTMQTDRQDEAAWVRLLKAKDDDAFEQLVRTFGSRMLMVARRYVGNEEDAEDVVQTAYLGAFRALNQFEGASQLSTWLHRIVVNTALMKLRSPCTVHELFGAYRGATKRGGRC